MQSEQQRDKRFRADGLPRTRGKRAGDPDRPSQQKGRRRIEQRQLPGDLRNLGGAFRHRRELRNDAVKLKSVMPIKSNKRPLLRCDAQKIRRPVAWSRQLPHVCRFALCCYFKSPVIRPLVEKKCLLRLSTAPQVVLRTTLKKICFL